MTQTSKLHIAILGPFDIENYGDHIFEKILIWKIQNKYPSSKLDIFSVFEGPHGFSEDNKNVYCIDDLESRHLEVHYDAIIVAGGSTIHFQTLSQDLRGNQVSYPLWNLWVIASYVAGKYSIPLAWNSPEIPQNFDGWEKLATRQLVEPVGYLSVRNKSSTNALANITNHSIIQSEDCAFLLPQYLIDNNIPDKLPEELAMVTKPLMVFHCNQRLDDVTSEQIASTLHDINNSGYQVLLLPLAYTNLEQLTLQRLNDKLSDLDSLCIDRKLSINETISVFKNCSLYVGLSFHGAISTYCFGGEIVAFDYERRRKTKELYARLGKSKHYTTSPEELSKVISMLTSKPLEQVQSPPLLPSIKASLDIHFTSMFSYLTSTTPCYYELSEIVEITKFEIAKRDNMQSQIQALSDNYAECYRQYQELRSLVP